MIAAMPRCWPAALATRPARVPAAGTGAPAARGTARALPARGRAAATKLGRLTNRLREQLHRYFPALLQLVPAADEPWLWALLERAPTPSAAQHLPRATLRTLLARHRIRRVDVETVRTLLRAPALAVAPGTVPGRTAPSRRAAAAPAPGAPATGSSAPRSSRRLLERLGESPEHRDVPILRSVVGVGRVVAATMLAEASRLLAARDYHALRAQAGRGARDPAERTPHAWCTCATRVIRACGMRSTIGDSPPLGTTRSVAPTTSACARAGTATAGRSVGSSIACSGSSWPCWSPARSMTQRAGAWWPMPLDSTWGIRSRHAATDAARPDGAQPPRSSARVPRGRATPPAPLVATLYAPRVAKHVDTEWPLEDVW